MKVLVCRAAHSLYYVPCVSNEATPCDLAQFRRSDSSSEALYNDYDTSDTVIIVQTTQKSVSHSSCHPRSGCVDSNTRRYASQTKSATPTHQAASTTQSSFLLFETTFFLRRHPRKRAGRRKLGSQLNHAHSLSVPIFARHIVDRGFVFRAAILEQVLHMSEALCDTFGAHRTVSVHKVSAERRIVPYPQFVGGEGPFELLSAFFATR